MYNMIYLAGKWSGLYINITFVSVLYSNKYRDTVWHSAFIQIMFQSFNMKSSLRTIDNQNSFSISKISSPSARRSTADDSARNLQRWIFWNKIHWRLFERKIRATSVVMNWGQGKDFLAISMLVTDVGDELCWSQLWDIGDAFSYFYHQQPIYLNINVGNQLPKDVTKIFILSPTF